MSLFNKTMQSSKLRDSCIKLNDLVSKFKKRQLEIPVDKNRNEKLKTEMDKIKKESHFYDLVNNLNNIKAEQ